ncbi:MAG: hypothetical protein NT124_03755 [Candidatus Dependentiae bacterium]|nr:hypothetical protein [Candidatus Dependentiae bacterium]
MNKLLGHALYALTIVLATSATTTAPMADKSQKTHMAGSKTTRNPSYHGRHARKQYLDQLIRPAPDRKKTVEKPKSFLEKCHIRLITAKKWIKSWCKKPTEEQASQVTLYCIAAYSACKLIKNAATSLYEAHKKAVRIPNIIREAILFDKCFLCQESFTPRTENANTPERDWPISGPTRLSTTICNNGHQICNDCLGGWQNGRANNRCPLGGQNNGWRREEIGHCELLPGI